MLTDPETAEHLAVHRTLARYAHALDQQDHAALAEALTDDATWTFTIAGAPGPGPVAGRTAILEFVRAATATQTEQRRHHLTNVIVAGGGVAYAYLLLTSPTGVVTTGRYTFALRRDDGEWRIAELVLDMDSAP